MTKNAYLSELADRLRQLPQSEIDKSIAYYSEIIDDRMEEGCSEEDEGQSCAGRLSGEAYCGSSIRRCAGDRPRFING